jgi:hypothetical protein
VCVCVCQWAEHPFEQTFDPPILSGGRGIYVLSPEIFGVNLVPEVT